MGRDSRLGNNWRSQQEANQHEAKKREFDRLQQQAQAGPIIGDRFGRMIFPGCTIAYMPLETAHWVVESITPDLSPLAKPGQGRMMLVSKLSVPIMLGRQLSACITVLYPDPPAEIEADPLVERPGDPAEEEGPAEVAIVLTDAEMDTHLAETSIPPVREPVTSMADFTAEDTPAQALRNLEPFDPRD